MIYFSSHLPSNAVPEAGQKICYRHLNSLSKNNIVHLVSFFNQMEKQFVDVENFSFCNSVFLIEITNVRRIWNLLCNFFLPLEVAVRSDARVLRIISNLLSSNSEREIFIEYEQAAFIIPGIPGDVRCTVVFHDVISQSIQRRLESSRKFTLKRFYYRYELKRILNWERQLARVVDKAIVLNEKDKALLVNLGFDPSRVEVEYPVVSDKFHRASRERFEPETILFWGAMNRAENEDAVLWFMSSIYPQVKKAIPALKFIVLGANPSERIKRLACDDVEVTGFVDDPIPYFERAALAIAPLRFGAGVKLKVLEAIAARLPVVGTSVAAEGVVAASEYLFVADSEDAFAQKVIEAITRYRS